MQVAAERVAWDMAKEHGFHLCVINPTFVLGPVVSSRTDATSIDVFKVCTRQMWDGHGASGYLKGCWSTPRVGYALVVMEVEEVFCVWNSWSCMQMHGVYLHQT